MISDVAIASVHSEKTRLKKLMMIIKDVGLLMAKKKRTKTREMLSSLCHKRRPGTKELSYKKGMVFQWLDRIVLTGPI